MADWRARLLAERAYLLAASGTTASGRRPVELDQQAVGRLSRMDAIRDQAMATGTEARRRARLAEVDRALDRLETGTFGRCQDCEEPIAPARLDLDPCTRLCVDCARG
ncbi:TraR/DksA family transcriptional regulator [Jannaschia aquimarina]|uniref:TraR/DksA family transcriptional regulator n=1 Tax=Jannaschia aquimarina TaxID=935700 RepID=UPI001F28B7DF|nr:TraR/DksA family transcriptional regulator [Jannaschia aquimarina]